MPRPARKTAHSSPAKSQLRSPQLPLAEVLSFLKETRGVPNWSVRDLGKALNVSAAVAKSVLPVLQAQGYIEASESAGWLTTAAGDEVAGSKPPRFTPEAVDAALSTLVQLIEAVNQDRTERFRVGKAVAFGDFLSGRARVQAPDVGVQLVPREPEKEAQPGSAVEEAAKHEVLRQLKAKGATLTLRLYEKWMDERSNRKIV
jgi:DNA-binding transcriptional regulator YhcF (GntR family)